MKTYTRVIWKNSLRNRVVHPLKYFEPESLEDLKQLARDAGRNGYRVRAVGSGHSFSDVAVAEDYLVDLKLLNKINSPDSSFINAGINTANMVEVEGGMTIRDFNKALDERNLAIVNMGGVDLQKLAGAISTGTHGSGIRLPAFPGMVRSLVLVAEGGKAYRIEPSDNPLTDPVKHRQQYPNNEIELLQDNDIFYSVLVCFGSMGILYSFILEVRPMYYLCEIRYLENWSSVKQKLRTGELFSYKAEDKLKDRQREKLKDYWNDNGNPNRGVMVRINPYKNDEGDHTCLVIIHRELKALPERTFGEATRNVITSALAAIPEVPFIIGNWIFNLFPKKTPRQIENSLRSEKDKIYINRAHKVLYLGLINLKVHGFDSEFAFRESDKKYLDTVDALFEQARQIADSSNLYQTGQIGLRFVAPSKAFLTPEYGQAVCYIDVSFLEGTRGSMEILNHYQDIMFRDGGKPHWGKLNNRMDGYPEWIRKWYPEFNKWQAAFARFNGKGTFRNAFTDRFRLHLP